MLERARIGITTLILVILLGSFACGPKPPGMPLLDAIDQDNADVVLDHMEFGTDPNAQFIPPGLPFAGASALHLAVLKGNTDIMKILIDNGAALDIAARNEDKASPIHWAAFFLQKDAVLLLIEAGAPMNVRDANGATPLDTANFAWLNNASAPTKHKVAAEIISILKEHGGETAIEPEPPGMPLLDAIDQENIAVVREHMELGTDPDEFIPPGFPFAGASALHLAVLKDNEEIAKVLLDNGADIDIRARDTFQGSPLEWAVFFGIKDMAVFLVESGADLNSKNTFGTTPLDATSIDNPFISPEDVEEYKKFNENRGFLREYLSARGGRSGQ